MENKNSEVYLAAFAGKEIRISVYYTFSFAVCKKILKFSKSSFPLDTFQIISEK